MTGFALCAQGSFAETHCAVCREGNAGDYAEGWRVAVPADAGAGRIFGYEDFREGLRVYTGQVRGAFADGIELMRNFRRGTEVMGSKGIAQAEMRDAAFCYDAMHAHFTERQTADGLGKLILLGHRKKIALENQAFWQLRSAAA